MTGAAALAVPPIERNRRLRSPAPLVGAGSVGEILARALEAGQREIGKPYSGPIIGQPDHMRYGNPGYDCSSFVTEMHERVTGLNLFSWAFTDTIANESRQLDPSEVLPGDIVSWRYHDGSQVGVVYPHTGLVFNLDQRLTLDCRFSSGSDVRIRPFLDRETHYFRHPALERLAGASATVFSAATIAGATNSGASAGAIAANWPLIEDALRERGILTKPVAAAAAATVAVETAHTFRPIHEFRNANGSIPAHWFTYSGGPEFHGRGYIQLTHDFNYRAAADALGVPDLAHDLDLALDPSIAARIFAWFFQDRGVSDAAERGDWENTRRRVLGGLGPPGHFAEYRGYIDRLLAS